MTSELFVQPIYNADYITPYWFEKINYPEWQIWFKENWTHSVYYTIVYLSIIYFGRKWMENREPYNRKVKQVLLYWNITLAIFSIIAFARVIPEINHLLFKTPNGFHISICGRENLTIVSLYWQLLGTLSKVVELGDTIFIILRKQPMILLHYYHHATVMVYTFYSFDAQDPVHRWFSAMNFGIHGIMYSYYALKSMGMKLPREISILLTSLQIGQMFFGIFVNVYSLNALAFDWGCDRRIKNIGLALLMYFSYFVLFAKFFHSAYITRSQKLKSKSN